MVRPPDYLPAAYPWREIFGYLAGRTEKRPVADSRWTQVRIKLHIYHARVNSHWNKQPRKLWIILLLKLVFMTNTRDWAHCENRRKCKSQMLPDDPMVSRSP